MPISLEVAALFAIEDQATATLGLIAEGMQRAGIASDELKGKLVELGQVSLAGINEGITAMAESLAGVNAAAAGVKDAAESAATAAGASARAAAASVDEITAAYTRAAEAQDRFRQAASGPEALGAGGGVGAYGGGGALFRGGRGVAGAYPGNDGIIDAEFSDARAIEGPAAPLMLGHESQRDAAEEIAEGYGLPRVMPRGFGRSGRGTRSAGPGGFTNPYTEGDESGPQINIGGRPHDDFLDIPAPPGGYWPPPGGGGGNGGGRGRSGGSANSGSSEKDSIHFGLAEMAEGWALYESLHSAAIEQNAIVRTELGLLVDPESPEGRAMAPQLRRTAREASAGTMYHESQTAAAGAVYARELGLEGQRGFKLYQSSFPVALKSAEISEQEGLGSLDSSLTANLEYAHMTRHYAKDELSRSLNVLQQLSVATSQPVAAEEKILKYSVPIGIAAGMDADKVAEYTGFFQQAGFNSSTAGTGLSHMILSILQSGGGINSHLEHGRANTEHELASALSLSPDQVKKARQEAHGSKHLEAMRDVGVVDGRGHITVLNQHGSVDFDAFLQKLSSYAQAHKPAQTMEAFHDLLGLQGERLAGVMTDPKSMDRVHQFLAKIDEGAARFGAETIQNRLASTDEQQYGQIGARLSDVGNRLMTAIEPVTHAVAHFSLAGLNAADNALEDHPLVAGALGLGTAGGFGYSVLRGGRGVLRIARALAHRAGASGAARAAGSAAAEATETAEFAEVLGGAGAGTAAGVEAAGAGAGLLGLLGIGPAIAGGSAAALGFGAGALANRVDKKHPWLAAMDNALYSTLDHLNPFTGGPAAPALPSVAAQAAAGGAVGAGGVVNHISVGPITITGVGTDIHMMVDKLFHDMADKLGTSLTHASGFGQGSLSSPFAIAPGF